MDFAKQTRDCCCWLEWWEKLIPRDDRPTKGSEERFLQEKPQNALWHAWCACPRRKTLETLTEEGDARQQRKLEKRNGQEEKSRGRG
jgi:hypothetical protein